MRRWKLYIGIKLGISLIYAKVERPLVVSGYIKLKTKEMGKLIGIRLVL